MITLEGQKITPTVFPDGTVQVWKLDYPEDKRDASRILEVFWKYENDGELIQLAQLRELLTNEPIQLLIEYLPYGRQDKEVSNNQTFGLISFAKLLNSLNFDKVVILDPHSEIALKLINNSHAFYYEDKVNYITDDHRVDLIVFPDKGALARYNNVYKSRPTIYADKVRNQDTGEIESVRLADHFNVQGKKLLIVDDICDGGATFVGLSKDLREKGATEVGLYVTYGLFTKGVEALSELDYIYTKDGQIK